MNIASKLLFLFISFSVCAFAKSNQGLSLEDLAQKYKRAQLIEMSVEKVVKSELLGKQTSYSGRIFLTQGKFRWENTTPERSLLVFDGNTIWSEQSPPEELGGPIQVAKGVVDKKNRSHILISSLMGEGLKKNFKINHQKIEGEKVYLTISPLKEGLTIKEITIVVSPADKIMREISYKDEIGNLTEMKFSNIKFSKKIKEDLFKYKPPQGAQVTDL